jgi:alginate O-acetyltransferase complex protein AlgJ
LQERAEELERRLTEIRGMEAVLAGEPPGSREQAINRTLRTLRGQIEAHGGSWEAWSAELGPFREDVRTFLNSRGGWAKRGENGFYFNAVSLGLLLRDALDAQEPDKRPFEAILSLDRQLKARGVDLIVMPIPDKVAVYPDYVAERVPPDRCVSLAMKRMMVRLLESDVEVIDLYTLFRDYRNATEDRIRLYNKRDTHWHNVGAQLAAAAIGRRLRRYAVVQEALAEPSPFVTVRGVQGGGTDMVPGNEKEKVRNDPEYRDHYVGVHYRDGRLYEDVPDSPIIITADSFGRINREIGAQTSAHVAKEIHMPVTLLHAMGSGPNIPWMLAREGPEYLEGRRVLIWTGVARQFVRSDWRQVDLP